MSSFAYFHIICHCLYLVIFHCFLCLFLSLVTSHNPWFPSDDITIEVSINYWVTFIIIPLGIDHGLHIIMVSKGKIPYEPIVTNDLFDHFILVVKYFPFIILWLFLFSSESFDYFSEVHLLLCLLLCYLSSSVYVKVISILVTTLISIVFRLALVAYLTMWVTSVSMQFLSSFLVHFSHLGLSWSLYIILIHLVKFHRVSSPFVLISNFKDLRPETWFL